MKELTIEKAWDLLIDLEIATEEELTLITHINGYSMESLDSVVYARTELNTVEQLKEEEGY